MWCLTHWFWLSYILPRAARNPMMEFIVSIALSSPVTFVKWHEKGRQTPLLILAYLSLGTDIAFPKETWPVLKEAVLGSGLTTQQYCGWSKMRFHSHPDFLLMAYAGFCSGSQKSELRRFSITFNQLQKGKTWDSQEVRVPQSTIRTLMVNGFVQISRWWRFSVVDSMPEFKLP